MSLSDNKVKKSIRVFLIAFFGVFVFCVAANAATALNIGDVASNVTDSFRDIAKLVTAGAYLAGLGFAVGAIMKFKQHKDNPTQIPIGTPIALLFIAAALIFLTTIFGVTGQTLFGSNIGPVAGPSGLAWTN